MRFFRRRFFGFSAVRLLCLSLAASLALPALAAAQTEPVPLTPDQRRVVAKCVICHAIDTDVDRTSGPSLKGIVGHKAAARPGFSYSVAMSRSALIWDETTLDAFLAGPARTVPGNRMAFIGIRAPAERKAIIAVLKKTGN